MSCKRCKCVSIPGKDICPECLIYVSSRDYHNDPYENDPIQITYIVNPPVPETKKD